MNDPIVDEVRRVRDAHSASFDYDLDLIFREIKEHEKLSGRAFVSFAWDAVPPNKELQAAPLTPTSAGAIPSR